MSRFVSVNFSIIQAGQASIPALSAAALYGRSAFTTLAFADDRPFLWESHWKRLTTHCRALSIEIDGMSSDILQKAVSDLVAANRVSTGKIRITIADTGPARLWPFESGDDSPAVIIAATDLAWTDEPMKLGISESTVNASSPLAGIKSGNYLEPLMCRENARKRGYAEAVRLNERGEVVSACLANLFWVREGRVLTAPKESGCLAGTIREFLMDECGVTESTAGLEELENADEIFLTSSGIGLCPAFLNDRQMNSGFPVARRLREMLMTALSSKQEA